MKEKNNLFVRFEDSLSFISIGLAGKFSKKRKV